MAEIKTFCTLNIIAINNKTVFIWKVCCCVLRMGGLSGNRLLAPEGKHQPNEDEGVKVENTITQLTNPFTISPLWL